MKKPLDFLVAGKSDPAARGLAKESDWERQAQLVAPPRHVSGRCAGLSWLVKSGDKDCHKLFFASLGLLWLRFLKTSKVDIDLMYSFGVKSGLPLQRRFRCVRQVQALSMHCRYVSLCVVVPAFCPVRPRMHRSHRFRCRRRVPSLLDLPDWRWSVMVRPKMWKKLWN